MKRNRHMNTGAALLTAALLYACGQTMYAQTNCGDEGQTSCSIFNNDYYYNNGWQACQTDLNDQSGNCINNVRHTHIGDADPWVTWAMEQQRQIGSAAQINWITTMGTHNSYSSANQGYTVALGQNQVYSITDQLEHGARILEIDAHTYLYDLNGGHLSVCHGTAVTWENLTWVTDSQACALTTPGKARYLSTAFQEIRTWMERNPNEVLTLFIDLGGPDNNNLEPTVSVLNPVSSLAVGAAGDFRSDFQNDLLNVFGVPLIWSADDTMNNGGHFPSIDMMLKSHKRLLLISNAQAEPENGLRLVHPLNFTDSNAPWPTNSDDGVYEAISENTAANALNGCYTASDTTTDQSIRSRDSWFRIGEGRTESDSSSNTLVYEPQVDGASLCSASYIEVDFLYALDRVPSGIFNRKGPDERYKASIWSWKEGDNGNGQTAVMSMSDHGRWISGYYADDSGQNNTYPAICMAVHADNINPPYWGSQSWFVTDPVPYSSAKTACSRKGGSFVAPYNARENSATYLAAQAYNGNHGNKYNAFWINYEANADAPHFQDSQEVFRYTTKGPAPQPQTVTVVGEPNQPMTLHVLNLSPNLTGTVSIAPASGSSFQTTPLTLQLDDSGRANFQVSLQPGPLDALGNETVASITAAYASGTAVEVLLVSSDKISSTEVASWLTNTSNPASEETPVTVHAQLNDTPGDDYHGTIQVFDAQTLEGAGPSLTPVKAENADGSFGIAQQRVDNDFPSAVFKAVLPAGPHQLVVKYEPDATLATSSQTGEVACWVKNPLPPHLPEQGQCPIPLLAPPDSKHTPGSGLVMAVTTTSHLTLQPASLSFSMRAGAPVPSSASIKVNTCNASVATDQPWLKASFSCGPSGRTYNPIITVNFSNASNLVPGVYSANVLINDKEHNPTGVVDKLPVKLVIFTTISANPGSVVLSPEHPNAAISIVSNPAGTVNLTAKTVVGSNALINLQVDQSVYPPVLTFSLNPLFLGPRMVGDIIVFGDVAPPIVIPVQITGGAPSF